MQPFPYVKNVDYQAVIKFLGDLYQANKAAPYWLPSRWEYATYLVEPLHATRGKPSWQPTVTLWKEDNKIVAMTNSEGPDENYFIHVAHSHKSNETLVELLKKISFPNNKLAIWALETDATLNEVLSDQGFQPKEPKEYLNWRDLSRPLPLQPVLAPEFRLDVVSEENQQSHFDCAAAAFKSQPVTRDVYKSLQSAPMYRNSLDLVILRDNQVVALCTVWFDATNELGYIEPVATHPDFQGKGLGRAILREALWRLNELGAKLAYVGAYGDDRMTFYNKCGFTNRVALVPWSM